MSATTPQADAWPNFFIVGEPRSGTTSLHTWLAELDHPELFMSDIKEPHWFSGFELPSIERSILRAPDSESAYLDLFAPGADRHVRGESSSYYLSDPDAPANIAAAVPDAKIVAILRNPVERAFSHYLLYGRRGTQTRSFAETIDHILSPETTTNLAYDFVEHGRFHTHLTNYRSHFAREQILVVLFDDLTQRPVETMRTVLEFLEVDTAPLEGFIPSEAQNSYTEPRGKLAARLLGNERLTRIGLKVVPRPLVRRIRAGLLAPGEKPQLDEATRERLEAIYAPELDRLEADFGVDGTSLRGRAVA